MWVRFWKWERERKYWIYLKTLRDVINSFFFQFELPMHPSFLKSYVRVMSLIRMLPSELYSFSSDSSSSYVYVVSNFDHLSIYEIFSPFNICSTISLFRSLSLSFLCIWGFWSVWNMEIGVIFHQKSMTFHSLSNREKNKIGVFGNKNSIARSYLQKCVFHFM